MISLLTSLLAATLPLAAGSPVDSSLLSRRCDAPQKSCTNTSFGFPDSFKWQMTGFNVHSDMVYSTPAHLATNSAQVSFNLTNPALTPAVVTCSASSSWYGIYFGGEQIYTCAAPVGTPVGGGRGGKATFDFNWPTGLLHVNQTWGCNDLDPKYPITFWAYGNVTLKLDCKTEDWQNPNWTMGQIYRTSSTKCAPISLPIKPYAIEAVA